MATLNLPPGGTGNAEYIDTYNDAGASTSATIGTHQTGDVFIAWAVRDGSSTAPSLASGWTDIASGGSNSLAYRLSWKVAASGAETSGTHTNATSLQIVHIRPTSGWTPTIGATSTALSSSATNISCPALTFQNTNDTSLAFAFYANRSADITNLTASPSGMTLCETNQDANETSAVYRTSSTSSGLTTQTTTFGGTASAARWFVVELKLANAVALLDPTGFSCTLNVADIDLAWTDTNSGTTTYYIEYSTNAGSSWTELTETAAGAETYTMTAPAAATYDFRIRAELGAGASNFVGGDTVVIAGDWQLSSGYYMPANQSMVQVYPRPDASTNSNARHRWAYYDGTNNVQYRIPVGVAFGAPPYKYEIITAPTGVAIGETYGSTDYGIVTWTPSGSETAATITVRVTDQGAATLDVTWTVTTSSATSRFIFVSQTGNDANSGSISSPKLTLANVFGSTFAATANAGATVYIRGSDTQYDIPIYTDNEISTSYTCLQFHTSRKPMAIVGFPGETPILDATSGRIITASGNGDDIFLQNLVFDGHMSSANNYRLFFLWGERLTFDYIRWQSADQGVVGDDNATMFFTSQESTQKNYLFINNCSEAGRTSGGANNYGFCSLYSRNYALLQGCAFTGAAHTVFYVKGTNNDVCIRYADINMSNAGDIASEGFAPSGQSNRIEWCYNKIKSAGSRSIHALESGVQNLWFCRNSLYNTRVDIYDANANGPHLISNNAIMSNASPIVDTGTQVTISGTECHGNMSSGVMDSTSLLLLGSYATNHRGRRGHEIWGG